VKCPGCTAPFFKLIKIPKRDPQEKHFQFTLLNNALQRTICIDSLQYEMKDCLTGYNQGDVVFETYIHRGNKDPEQTLDIRINSLTDPFDDLEIGVDNVCRENGCRLKPGDTLFLNATLIKNPYLDESIFGTAKIILSETCNR